MGITLHRPAALAGGLHVPDVLDPFWVDVLRFCGVSDLGACLSVNKPWHAAVDGPNRHAVWADAYARTQRVDSRSAPSGEGELRALIERPFGEGAVGWRVAVLVEDGSGRHATGRIDSYNADTDEYLVVYDNSDDSESNNTRAWEQERRKRTAAMRHNPSLAGKSRFLFLSPPVCSWPHQFQGFPGGEGCASPSGSCRSSLRFRSWKQELENNVRNAPSRLLRRLEEHSDEVLFVVFSPCGTRLASCSRDLRTVIFRLRSPATEAGPLFEREAIFTHQTAPCRAIWWPHPPYSTVVVSTEDAGWQGASKVEVWEILEEPLTERKAGPESQWEERPAADGAEVVREGAWADLGMDLEAHGPDLPDLPVGFNARCVFQGQNQPFDIYAAVLPWPLHPPSELAERQHSATASADASPALTAVGGGLQENPSPSMNSPNSLCFLSGWAVFRENEHYVQWLSVWPGPQHPAFRPGREHLAGGAAARQIQGPTPLARLRLEGEMNYLHCLEVGPDAQRGRILAMTGSTPHLCNELGLIDLTRLRRRGELQRRGEAAGGEVPVPTYDAPVEVKSMGERVVLSVKWNGRGDLILLNTRPYAQGAAAQEASPPVRGQRSRASFEDLLLRPAPDLSTSMELLLLDASSLETVGLFDGHFAFTTKESPFLIFTDEWCDSDFLASGGEDHRVYVWHRRHRQLIRRLSGHTEPVNAVSWNGAGLLASASDDHSVIIWASGATEAARSPSGRVDAPVSLVSL